MASAARTEIFGRLLRGGGDASAGRVGALLAWTGAFLGCLRFVSLSADFPNFSRWSLDQAKYTDEGWWGAAAGMQQIVGHWYMAGDYNPAVVVPVWPLGLNLLFRVTGVSLLAARSLSVTLSLALMALVYMLIRRFARSELAAGVAVVMLATSPIAFVFSRLAILEAAVGFGFWLLLWVAAQAGRWRRASLVGMALLIPCLLLTKTTAAVLLPAVAWMAWRSLSGTVGRRLLELCAVGTASALLWKMYVVMVFRQGFGQDYRYFYDINQVEEIDWRQTGAWVWDLLKQCTWVDRVLYPLALVVLVTTVWRWRGLWRNPLFRAAWLAVAGQATYIFVRQGNYAPRYFLPMLAPVVIIIALALDEAWFGARTVFWAMAATCGVVAVSNLVAIGAILHGRTYQFWDAGRSIGQIVRADAAHSPMMMGVSGASLSLMTGMPSINDVYGTETLDQKIARYKPGWYVAWMGIGPEEQQALAGYRITQIAVYPAFDDDERNRLILYRLDAR